MLRFLLYAVLPLWVLSVNGNTNENIDADTIIRKAMDNWRGLSSYSEMTMTIHRENWERKMSLKAWTEGEKRSLVRVTKPKKDMGNATLIIDKDMWSFAPKINRVIKIPSSMMNQSWMGSDFSNRDISRSTEIIERYTHVLTRSEQRGEYLVYTITSTPKEDAPVVWGKEVLEIREDFVMLRHEFWDQDGVLVKVMETTDIQEMGGRAIASSMRMSSLDTPDEWTSMTHHNIKFDLRLPKNIFTLSNLRNSRQ